MARWRAEGIKLPAPDAPMLRVAVPALLATAAITALVLMVLWRDQSTFKPVYGARENVAVAEMVAVLDAEKIGYRLHPESGQLLVRDGEVGRARMLLAAKGVVAKLPEGLELLDRNDPLGVSQFVQDVRFRRGLEGELTRSITSIDAVQAARVHLSMPRSSSFVVNTAEKSSASVLLTLRQGQTLSPEQIAAIVHLVAGSTAGLDPSRVTLTDQAGNYLSARIDLSEGFQAAAGGEAERRYTDEARRNAREMLLPMLGDGHFRISVTAEVGYDRVEETLEQYRGEPRIVSEATREESERQRMALGVPGSLSNRPIEVAPAAPGADGANSFRGAQSRNYAYDRSVSQIKRARGQLARQSVAVVVDDHMAPGGTGAWTADSLARIETMLRTGLGIDEARGDRLSVTSAPFPRAEPPPPWWQQPHHIVDVLTPLLWALSGLFAFVLARSLIRAWNKPRDERGGPITPELLHTGPQTPVQAAQLPGAARQATVAMVPLLENVDLPPPGSPVDVMVEHLRVLADKEPLRVAEVVKQWVQRHGEPHSGAP
jgi:flagellar M-ring protein FliF